MPDPLRNDVRLLGELLGRVLLEYGGSELLEDVEKLRALAIAAHHEDGDEAFKEAEALVASFGPVRAEQVANAFTCYFHLTNTAEEFHRVRVLRERESELGAHEIAVDDSLPTAFGKLAAEVGRDEAIERLQNMEFRPVVTAHPTEARRGAVARIIRRVADLISERDALHVGGTSRLENERRLLAEIDLLWRTSPLRAAKPTVLDEVRTVTTVFSTTFYEVFPAVYRRLDDWLQGEDAGLNPPLVKPFVHLGSWIGGDRDGNPNVTAQITKSAVVFASDHLLAQLEQSALDTSRSLTLADDTTVPSPEMQALWLNYRGLSAELANDVAAQSPGELHRQAMMFIAERIGATRRRDADLGYPNPQDLVAELQTVQSSLVSAGARRAAYGDLQTFIWQVQSFGFHLAELEIRQHSQVHAAALVELEEHGITGELSERTLEVVETIRAIATLQKRFGVEAARRYIVSFTQSAQHLADVYRLIEIVFPDPATAPVVDAVPLFETFADLEASVEILEQMLQHPVVERRLAENGRRMEVMLGYSDSSKDVGPVSATLALDKAQRLIAQWAQDNDIELTLFHGRGGALGRGGGPANRAVLAQPPHSVDGRFKLTEQGEVIFARYGDQVIAARHIEQVAAATLLASAPSTERRNEAGAKRFVALSEKLDEISRRRFHELVRSEGFPAWFAQVTPLEEIGLLPIGSRPARRGLSVESLEDLRAIPWVFSWSQARTNLAGWYGLGTALEEYGDVEELRAAYQHWPLFTTLIDNIEMSLAKTDERIASRYLALGDRDDLAEAVLSELALTKEWLLKITGGAHMLSNRRILGRAVQLRGPYVDALSLIQLRALRALRTEEVSPESVKDLQRLLLLSVNGVSAGLQNTG